MATPVRPIPEGYHTVTPYLIVPGVTKLIGFLEAAFGARVTAPPMVRPDGSTGHVEVQVGDSRVMMSEPSPGFAAMPAMLYLYVEDTDALYESALRAGAESVMAPADHFYGDRNAGVKDPSGNLWWLATHVEDVSPEEIARRAAAQAEAHREAAAAGASH